MRRYTNMIKILKINGEKFSYTLEYKNVKNINLRIRPSGEIYVSANKRTSVKTIESFIVSKAEFILKAVEKFGKRAENPLIQYFSEDEVCKVIEELCQSVYPYFEKCGVNYPKLKFKKLKSRWGSCQPSREILTFNINLMYAPLECIRYVVLHEFTHFLQANHSQKFYAELEKTCPDWKILRKKLKEISI